MASLIQSLADAQNTDPNSITYASNITAGSLLVVIIRDSTSNAGDPTVTDSRGNTWQRDGETTTTNRGSVFHYSAIAADSGACTITVAGAATLAIRLAAYEFSGAWDSTRLEQYIGNATPNANPQTSGDATVAGGAVLVAAMGTQSDVTADSVSNSFTLGPQSAGNRRGIPAHRIVTSAGTYGTAFTFTGTSNGSVGSIAAYREVLGPTITVQPVADTVILSNETSASFSVTATGTGTLLYDWELEDGVGSGVYANLANGSGATWTGQASASCSAALTAKTLTGRRVRCNVTDDNGTTTTNAVALTIWDGPQVTTFPATDGDGESTATLTSDYVTGVGEAIEVRIPLSDGDVAVTVTTT